MRSVIRPALCLAAGLVLSACATQESTPTASEATPASSAPAPRQSASGVPAPPYYSVQLMTVSTERMAHKNFKLAGDADFVRAEKRGDAWAIRAGAWSKKADAMAALKTFKANGASDAYVIHCHTQPEFVTP